MKRAAILLFVLGVTYNLLQHGSRFESEQAQASEWGKKHYFYSGKGEDKLSILTLKKDG